ncbi:hypothetical protein BKA61DRAFT_17135 [Leptodontidium sp. MPI-SDFR-AT-0119]|nr:hypothetical protein BKA61DRAFT_17135 [Leptodontidium sp. MPI-SDFR-AT-0119]
MRNPRWDKCIYGFILWLCTSLCNPLCSRLSKLFCAPFSFFSLRYGNVMFLVSFLFPNSISSPVNKSINHINKVRVATRRFGGQDFR